MPKLLVTGATGFLGNALANLARAAGWDVLPLLRADHDLRAPIPAHIERYAEGVDYIVHAAGEVHGIRSVSNPAPFVESNVLGTFHMLELARKIKPRAFLYVSTAEVYGPSEVAMLPELYIIPHKETDALRPQNPYAASKAAAEALVHSYYRSFNLPTITVRTMNLFGERQAADKFIPKVLSKILAGETAEIHTSEFKADIRQWIHVETFAKALLFLLDNGMYGQTYNVAGEAISNLELAKAVAVFADRSLIYKTVDISKSPAHDIAYAISDEKIRQLGWDIGTNDSLNVRLFKTVYWYMHQ